MTKIDDIFPNIGVISAFIITTVVATVLQLSGSWFAMLVAGALGSLFIRRHRFAFLVGFLGALVGWLILYIYLIATAQALTIADFFFAQLGPSGLGWLVIVIGCILGGLLGGFGGLFGRSMIEFIDELLPSGDQTKADPEPEPEPEE
ncbi:MAG: hypothetical protein RTV31_10730 [Candidatus Thorarchaeota archaeon]